MKSPLQDEERFLPTGSESSITGVKGEEEVGPLRSPAGPGQVEGRAGQGRKAKRNRPASFGMVRTIQRSAVLNNSSSSACHLRQFLEKLLDHHFGCSIDQALADGRDRTPYLRVSFVGHLSTSVSRPELQQALAF